MLPGNHLQEHCNKKQMLLKIKDGMNKNVIKVLYLYYNYT